MDGAEEATIVIGGGVGPMAGVALHARIIENTLGDGSDQSHLAVHHYSVSARIPDRTAYLVRLARASGAGASEAGTALGPVPGPAFNSGLEPALGPDNDPALGMAGVFIDASLALRGRPAVGGVPCNTFHAPAIFTRFLSALEAERTGIRIVNMLAETMIMLRSRLGPPRAGKETRIGLLSTTGTRLSGVYDQLLREAGFTALYVPEEDQAAVHAAIYDPVWGIKATSVPGARAVETVADMASRLVDQGAGAVILACTELPLALSGREYRGVPLLDPVLALARALIREAAPSKLKPL